MLLQKCKMKKCSTSVKKCSVEGQCIWHRECSTPWVTSEAPRSQEPRGTNAKTDHENNGTGSCVSPLREAFLKYGLFIFTKAPQRMSLTFYGWELRELKGEIFEAGSPKSPLLHLHQKAGGALTQWTHGSHTKLMLTTSHTHLILDCMLFEDWIQSPEFLPTDSEFS